MNIKIKKILGILFLAVLMNACYNDCSDFEPKGAPTVKFQIIKLGSDSLAIADSLLQLVYHGVLNDSALFVDSLIIFQLYEPPAVKNKTTYDDSLSVFYNDTLHSKLKLTITKTKATCFDVYTLSKVVINDSTFCTSNCASVVYEVSL